MPAIWAFDPATKRLLPAGQLQVPVSHAAVAVTGSTAWIVGGESGGAWSQRCRCCALTAAFGTAGAPGAGSPYLRGQAADRRPGQQPAAADGRGDARGRGGTRRRGPADATRCGSTFPTTRSSSTTARRSSPIRSRTRRSLRSRYPSGRIIWSYGHPGAPGHGTGVPERARRRLPAEERPDDGGRRAELPGAGDQRERDGRAPDRHQRRVRASPAGARWARRTGTRRCRR